VTSSAHITVEEFVDAIEKLQLTKAKAGEMLIASMAWCGATATS
jgi:hypothetical protein